MHRFLVVIEKANENHSAYSPDLPGCIATGGTREETERNMHEAIQMHVQGLIEDGLPVPESESFAEFIAVPYNCRLFSYRRALRLLNRTTKRHRLAEEEVRRA